VYVCLNLSIPLFFVQIHFLSLSLFSLSPSGFATIIQVRAEDIRSVLQANIHLLPSITCVFITLVGRGGGVTHCVCLMVLPGCQARRETSRHLGHTKPAQQHRHPLQRDPLICILANGAVCFHFHRRLPHWLPLALAYWARLGPIAKGILWYFKSIAKSQSKGCSSPEVAMLQLPCWNPQRVCIKPMTLWWWLWICLAVIYSFPTVFPPYCEDVLWRQGLNRPHVRDQPVERGTGLTNELLNISPRHYCLSHCRLFRLPSLSLSLSLFAFIFHLFSCCFMLCLAYWASSIPFSS